MNKNTLERKTLIDIIDRHNKGYHYSTLEMYAILVLLKKEIEKHEYYEDKRFMPELKDGEYRGRQIFLKEEAQRRIEADNIPFAYKNLFELICAHNPDLYCPAMYRDMYKKESDKVKHEDYYKDGIICEKEKNIIMEMITLIEKYHCEKYVIKNENEEINYLKLGETYFKLKDNKSSLRVNYNAENFISIDIDISFEEGIYDDLDVSPHIVIDNVKTSNNKLDNLKGVMFEINDVNESFYRGDSFYLYESEPFVKYKIEILEIDGQNVHIQLNGVAITDGYSKPCKTEDFIVDVIVPIIVFDIILSIPKENQKAKLSKDKIKSLIGLTLFGLVVGFLGVGLLFRFDETDDIMDKIVCIFVSILMFVGMILCLASVFFEVFNKGKKVKINNSESKEKLKNNMQQLKIEKNPISKSVRDKLTEETYNKLRKIYIGWDSEIVFFDEKSIDAGQIGFRYTGFFNEIEEIIDEWPGNEYVIIGYDPTVGCGPDPYIMKTDEKELPIYWLMTDGGDWENPTKIANSFDDFIKIIDCINENINSKDEINKELILNEIIKINSNEKIWYWESLLEGIISDYELKYNSSKKISLN